MEKNQLNKVDMHFDICTKLNKIYEQKNHDYGDSFHDTFVEEGPAMARIRLSDKLNRFKKLSRLTEEDGQLVKDESIEDTLLDLANYAIMTVMEMRLAKIEVNNKLTNKEDFVPQEVGPKLLECPYCNNVLTPDPEKPGHYHCGVCGWTFHISHW